MAITFDDTALMTGHVAELRALKASIDRALSGATLQLTMRARYDDALMALDTALDAITCELCDRAAVIDRQSGAFCPTCSDRFVICDGCREDVTLADAVTPEGVASGFFHGACCPGGY